ncbi:MAG: type IV pilus assembly protein PilM [Candidatus Buchananbacteria bacterium]|nr:type IV pilus assembly protein PilM [Candidatus Buchananbacteria bacterium]
MVKKEIFGLDISDYSIEALQLTKPLFGKPKITAYARSVFKTSLVKDGIIKDKKKLQDSLVKLLDSAKPQKIRTPFCVLSLPDSQVFTTVFKLPAGLKHKEIKNTIPFKAEEVIPFKSSEVYYDFKTITVEGASQEIFYAAVPVKVVDAYVEVLEAIGLKPIAFDLESLSLARILIDVNNKKSAKLLMDIGSRTTNLTIFDRQGIRASGVVKVAGGRFTKAIMAAKKITEKSANELKIKTGFDSKKDTGKVVAILQNESKKVVGEAKQLIEFYQAEAQRHVDEIILAGGSALLPSIDQHFANSFGLVVNLGKPFAKIKDPGALGNVKGKEIIFSNVLGLALRGIEKKPETSDINLLPLRKNPLLKFLPEKGDRKHWQRFFTRLAILILMLAGLLAVITTKQQGVDFYNYFSPASDTGKFVPADINLDVLDQLRDQAIQRELASTTEALAPKTMVRILPTSAGYANVRDGAGAEFSKVGEAKSGSEYELLERGEEWHKIKLDDKISGWVFSTFTELFETSTTTPAAESSAENNPEVLGVSNETKPIKIRVKENAVGYLNVREGAATSFKKVGSVPVGGVYEVVEESDGWYKIKDASVEGWVYGIYFDIVE